LQNYLLNSDLNQEYALIKNDYLGKESKIGWEKLEVFWNGRGLYDTKK
jgi:hypothetical protein